MKIDQSTPAVQLLLFTATFFFPLNYKGEKKISGLKGRKKLMGEPSWLNQNFSIVWQQSCWNVLVMARRSCIDTIGGLWLFFFVILLFFIKIEKKDRGKKRNVKILSLFFHFTFRIEKKGGKGWGCWVISAGLVRLYSAFKIGGGPAQLVKRWMGAIQQLVHYVMKAVKPCRMGATVNFYGTLRMAEERATAITLGWQKKEGVCVARFARNIFRVNSMSPIFFHVLCDVSCALYFLVALRPSVMASLHQLPVISIPFLFSRMTKKEKKITCSSLLEISFLCIFHYTFIHSKSTPGSLSCLWLWSSSVFFLFPPSFYGGESDSVQ